MIMPFDDPTWCAQSVVADLQPLCLGYVWGWGRAHLIAHPWVPISSPLTHRPMVYQLPFCFLAAPKAFPPVRPGYNDKYRSRSYRCFIQWHWNEFKCLMCFMECENKKCRRGVYRKSRSKLAMFESTPPGHGTLIILEQDICISMLRLPPSMLLQYDQSLCVLLCQMIISSNLLKNYMNNTFHDYITHVWLKPLSFTHG